MEQDGSISQRSAEAQLGFIDAAFRDLAAFQEGDGDLAAERVRLEVAAVVEMEREGVISEWGARGELKTLSALARDIRTSDDAGAWKGVQDQIDSILTRESAAAGRNTRALARIGGLGGGFLRETEAEQQLIRAEESLHVVPSVEAPTLSDIPAQ